MSDKEKEIWKEYEKRKEDIAEVLLRNFEKEIVFRIALAKFSRGEL